MGDEVDRAFHCWRSHVTRRNPSHQGQSCFHSTFPVNECIVITCIKVLTEIAYNVVDSEGTAKLDMINDYTYMYVDVVKKPEWYFFNMFLVFFAMCTNVCVGRFHLHELSFGF